MLSESSNFSGKLLKEIPLFSFPDLTTLDLSSNFLTEVSGLSVLRVLRHLILDDNLLSNDSIFPSLPSLETLSLTSNKIENYAKFTSASLRRKCPNLIYLSLLKNPCCSIEFALSDSEEYQIYRYIILLDLPRLEHLDALPVGKDEKENAKKWREESYTPLNAFQEKTDSPSATFGKQVYFYQGKQSEGNRFIKNDEL